MNVDLSYTIDENLVYLLQDLGNNFKVYWNNDCVDPVYYITKVNTVIIKFSAHINGDDMSCITDELFELVDKRF